MDHVRIDPKFRRRPRPKRAGWAAREVFKFLLEVSAEFDLRGRLAPSMQDIPWLADEWANGDEDATPTCAAMLEAGLHQLEVEGMIHREGPELVISDWEDFYKPTKTPAERAKGYRARHAPSRAVTDSVTRDARHESNATEQHYTEQHYTKSERTQAPVEANAPPSAPMPGKAPGEPVAAKAPHVPNVPSPPTTPREGWLFPDFWGWAQHKRHQAGLVPEPPPNMSKGGSWWSTARSVASTDELCAGFLDFGDDPYWQGKRPALPFAGFMSQWHRFVTVREENHAPQG